MSEQQADAAGEALDAGNYEVIRARLLTQGKTLRGQAEALNTERKAVFGGTELTVAANSRVRTENNCVPRDIVSVGGHLLLGYHVTFGLKQEMNVGDVFGLHDFAQTEGDAEFHSREVRAEAEVAADPEREVARVACQVEGLGVVEDVFVAVGRGVDHQDLLSFADVLAAEGEVPGRGPREAPDGRDEPEEFLDRDGNLLRVVEQAVAAELGVQGAPVDSELPRGQLLVAAALVEGLEHTPALEILQRARCSVTHDLVRRLAERRR